jgi:hypothetical protein
MLNTKANKPTVAQALHRKANKGEVDDLLSQKVNFEDFERLILQINEKASIGDLHHLQTEIETKPDRIELRELLLNRTVESKDSVDRSLYNTLSKDREYTSSKLENLELQLKSHVSKIDNEIKDIIDSFNSGLSKKADYRDLDAIGTTLLNKADIDNVADMISEAKDQVFDKLRKTKDELIHQRKDLAEEMFERHNKQNQKIEKCLKDVKSMRQASNQITDESQKIKSDVKEIIYKEAETITMQVRDEINKAMDEWHSARIKIENELSQKVRKADLIEFKNEVNNRIEPKVEISEVQSALNALQTELANRQINSKIELQNIISANQEYVSHSLSKK